MKGILEQIEKLGDKALMPSEPLTIEILQKTIDSIVENRKNASKEWTELISHKEYEEFNGDIEKIINNRIEILSKQLR